MDFQTMMGDMQGALSHFQKSEMLQKLFITLILVILVGVLRTLFLRQVFGSIKLVPLRKRTILVQTRNVALLLLLFGVLLIWAEQIRALALSIIAIAAALVIATKELLLCLSGSLIKMSSNAFAIGDQIEVNNVRGYVIDHNLLSTTLLEIGPGHTSHQMTGRSITLPNAMFLNSAITNESFTDDYVLHIFSIPIAMTLKWKEAETLLLEIARKECEPYFETGKNHMLQVARREGIEPPNLDPRVYVHFQENEQMMLMLRLMVPAKQKGKIEQEIIHEFLTKYLLTHKS